MRKALMRLTIIGAIPFVIMGAGMLLGQSTGVNFLSSLAWFLRIVTIILGIFLLLRYFYLAVIKNPQLKENDKNILLGIYAFTISILSIELGLTFYSQSTLNPASYSSINWFMFNWKPINSEGFRDDEVNVNIPIDVIFMGDSFTAGVGVKDYKKRFSNLVKTYGGYNTYNMGRNGQNLKGIISQLQHLSLKPKYIFVQYYVNDIIQTGEELGFEYEPIRYNLPESFTMYASYLFNYFYTRKYNIADDEMGFLEHLNLLQANPQIWKAHLKEIDEIVKYSKTHDAKLVFILFPFLPDPSQTVNQIESINQHILSKKIGTIQVGEIIKEANLKIEQCMVNKYDEHPSTLVHELLAEEIVEYLHTTQH